MCVLNDRYMLVIGGWNSDTEKIFNEMWIFDTQKLIWRQITTFSGDEISERES